jgi:hypothetical protein
MWSQDFKEFVSLLNAHGVEYLIVGGYAVGVHGHPRYTGDLDVSIDPSADNPVKMVTVLNGFGFGQFKLKPEDFAQPGRVLQFGYPPFRIDIMMAIDGVEFADCFRNRLTIDYEGQPVFFIGLEEFEEEQTGNRSVQGSG